jgi:hypothetical protein
MGGFHAGRDGCRLKGTGSVRRTHRQREDGRYVNTKTWTVQVRIDEQGDDTLADATLSMDNKTEIRGHGTSRRNPRDESEPRIGDELATARALSDLAHHLLAAAATDIESKTHVPARSLQL